LPDFRVATFPLPVITGARYADQQTERCTKDEAFHAALLSFSSQFVRSNVRAANQSIVIVYVKILRRAGDRSFAIAGVALLHRFQSISVILRAWCSQLVVMMMMMQKFDIVVAKLPHDTFASTLGFRK
jgi:hypothetical protein